jgi:Zn-finger nucleic acid-binding protein
MNCPRCSTELTDVIIEGSKVMACKNCEGTWYPDEALADVTDHSFSELKETPLAHSLVPDQLAKVDLDEPISCPECQKEMGRYTYSLVCPIVLDECTEHGVWLDDGELGTLMQYLTDLDKRVGATHEAVLNERNLSALAELSKSPTFYSLPGNVLATLNGVRSRPR